MLNEAQGLGMAERKDRAKSSTGDAKARDAARKRAERSKMIPREKRPSQDLIKDVVLVKTRSGRTQLIFKDSFNASYHQKLNKQDLTIEEAKKATQEQDFEQTRASKLLFGDTKAKTGGGEREKKAEEKKAGEAARPKPPEEREKSEKQKAKKLSQQQILQTMTQMTPEQLAGMPPELRNQYFQMTRKPATNSDFDQMSYENLTVAFGLSDISGVPYNQQVLNALVFLAKMKAGASQQEIQTYLALDPGGREFTRPAFFTAKKILSQIGDQCIQSLLTNVETTGKPVNAEGAADMACGDYKFKVSAGGEVSFSSTDFNQSNKNFKGLVGRALTQALTDLNFIQSDQKLSSIFTNAGEVAGKFAQQLIPDNLLPQIRKNPKLLQKLQNTPVKDAGGNVVGTVIDVEGNLNPLASLNNYQQTWQDAAHDMLKGSKDNALKQYLSTSLLKTVMRGDGIVPPEVAPNHLVTVNGIFPMTDDYFSTLGSTAKFDVKKSKDVITSSNIENYKPSAAEMLNKFSTVVEQKEEQQNEPELDLKSIMIDKKKINPSEMMVDYIVRNNDFLLNASLLPGFSPNDLNSVQYNYVTVGGKTTKIPVMKDDNVTNQILGEEIILLNDLLIEALSNNFILSELLNNRIITDAESNVILQAPNYLVENAEYVSINLKSIFENAKARIEEYPELFESFIESFMPEEYKRDYKMEYRNYHGKPKQRKERAKRTKAREQMIKKGKVKKGDGKDIDHKRPLRHGGSNGINNWRIRDRSKNRSDNGHHKGEKQSKDWK